MKILSTLILIITTFFKKLKIQELLRENVKEPKKLLFFTHKLRFFERLSPGGGSGLVAFLIVLLSTWDGYLKWDMFQQKKKLGIFDFSWILGPLSHNFFE